MMEKPNYIDENTSSLYLGLNQIYELSFTIYCQDKASWFDALQEGMYLFVEKIGLFKMNQPSSNIDDKKYSKDIIARSCETELEDKNCSLQFNMGLKTSQEYLVTYDEDETESLINPYTGIPYVANLHTVGRDIFINRNIATFLSAVKNPASLL